jgi:hypothetical protein
MDSGTIHVRVASVPTLQPVIIDCESAVATGTTDVPAVGVELSVSAP